jgi:hypothetical protein
MPVIGTVEQTLWQRKVAVEERGRVLASRQAWISASFPLAAIAAGLLSDRYFLPSLMPGGALAESVGSWFGVGPGRGIGFLSSVAGALCVSNDHRGAILYSAAQA